MTCSTCQHFLSRGVTDASAEPKPLRLARDEGICRRYPPRLEAISWDPEHGTQSFSAFPTVHQNQRCGEFLSSPNVGER